MGAKTFKYETPIQFTATLLAIVVVVFGRSDVGVGDGEGGRVLR